MRRRFYSLKKAKIRQSWNKYNLYNLARARPLQTRDLTYFQQKWAAKAATRAYHGETVREKQWQRQFRRSIKSVVSMDAESLAKDDGSRQAMGRGAGLQRDPARRAAGQVPRTPYMGMVFAPTERRLDTAIFRALFASSTRQARQFVVHGYVRVNGKKMIYPGYQLNPGDMFQVEPERVLFATGAPKLSEAELKRRSRRGAEDDFDEAPRSRDEGEEEEGEEGQDPDHPSASSETSAAEEGEGTAPESQDSRPALKSLMAQAKTLLKNPAPDLRAKQKQDLRAFSRLLRTTLSKHRASAEPLATDLDSQLAELTDRLNLARSPSSSPSTSTSSSTTQNPSTTSPSSFPASSHPPPSSTSPSSDDPLSGLTPHERAQLAAAIAEADENPYDPSKPYATPWRPRDWMSAFAFIPRYLEVHQKVCSAVYVRHPVARPGLAEVPTPFNLETSGLAFNWYLRRR